MSLSLRQSSTLNELTRFDNNGQTEYAVSPILKLCYIGENDYIIMGETRELVREPGGSIKNLKRIHIRHYSRENSDSYFDITPKTDFQGKPHLATYGLYSVTYQNDFNFDAVQKGNPELGVSIYISRLTSEPNAPFPINVTYGNKVEFMGLRSDGSITEDDIVVPYNANHIREELSSWLTRDLKNEDFYITKLFHHKDVLIIATASGLIYTVEVQRNPLSPTPRPPFLGVLDTPYNNTQDMRPTHFLNVVKMNFEESGHPYIEDSISKTFIVQGASELINVWNYPYDNDADEHEEPSLLFSYNLPQLLRGDTRRRSILNGRRWDGRHVSRDTFASAISRDVIDKYNLLVGISVPLSSQPSNSSHECFLGVVYCGDSDNESERLWFPKFTGSRFDGLRNSRDSYINHRNPERLDSEQETQVFSYKKIYSLVGIHTYNNKIEITAIEIIDADYFVTGDNEGRIMLWKLNRVVDDFKNSTLTYMSHRNHLIPNGYIERYGTNIKKIIKDIKAMENNQLLVHIYVHDTRGTERGFYNTIEVLNYSFDRSNNISIFGSEAPRRFYHEATNEPRVAPYELPGAMAPTTIRAAADEMFARARAELDANAAINMDLLQEYDDYTNIQHTERGKREMMKNVERVFDMKKDIIEPSVKSEEELKEFRTIDIERETGQDVMDIRDDVKIYDFGISTAEDQDTAVIFKTANKNYMYAKSTLDSMNFPYGQMVYGCREASGEWRDENRINNIILDDLYVSLGTLIEDRGILVPLVPLLKIYRKGIEDEHNIISFCLINDRPQDMNKVVAVAKLPFSGGVGRLHCNAGGDDSADILYNVYEGIHDPFLSPPLPDSDMEVVPPPPPSAATARATDFDGVSYGNMTQLNNDEVFYQRINNLPVGDSGRINLYVVNVRETDFFLFREDGINNVESGNMTIDWIVNNFYNSSLREIVYGEMSKIKIKDWLEDEPWQDEPWVEEIRDDLEIWPIITRLINEAGDLNLFVGGDDFDNVDKYVILVDEIFNREGNFGQYIYIGRYNTYNYFRQVIYRLGVVLLGLPAPEADSEMEVVPPSPPDSENNSVSLEYNYSDSGSEPSGSEPGSRSRTPSLGGKRKSNRKKSLKNKRKTKKRKTLKKKKRKTIKKSKKKRKTKRKSRK